MKVGILTFHAYHHYGAMLQAYAVQKAVLKLGHEAQIIDLYTKEVRQWNRSIKWVWTLRRIVKNMLLLVRFGAADQCRAKRYELFREKYFRLTRGYKSESALRMAPPIFDAYVVGSDQVWNCERGIESVWLFDFVKTGRRISYAPSFGTDRVDSQYHDVFRRYLPTFDSLSCREGRGVEMIREMTGLVVEQVLDPTLLLSAEEWSSLSERPEIPEPYLLVYCLAESPEFMDLVVRMSQRTGLRPVFISKHDSGRLSGHRVIRVRNAGPSEFLGLFKNADMVCTNSFHGIAFSINFRKNFFALKLASRNVRIEGLLKLLGLENRQLNSAVDFERLTANDLTINYDRVKVKLQEAVDASVGYLKKALS